MLNDGYNSNLNISKDNPIFGVHDKERQEKEDARHKQIAPNIPKDIEQEPEQKAVEPEKKVETPKKEDKKYTYICYFYAANGTLTPAIRELKEPVTVKNAVNLLLKGPTIAEAKAGIHSEIPMGVDLISVKNTDKAIIVNLTSNFGNGGGSESIDNRLKQLSKTVKRIAPKKQVYLYINGSEVEYLGGEGVYVKQPLD